MDRLQELMNELETLKVEANKLATAQEINAKLEEIENTKALIKVEEMKVADEKAEAENKINAGKMTNVTTNTEAKEDIYNGELFTRAIANSILVQRGLPTTPLTTEQQNAITEKIGEDGGYAVPEDISVKINKRLKEKTDVFYTC